MGTSALTKAGRCAPQLLGADAIPAFLLRLDQGLDIDATQLQGLLNQEFLKGKDLLAPASSSLPSQSNVALLTFLSFLFSPLRTSRGHFLLG